MGNRFRAEEERRAGDKRQNKCVFCRETRAILEDDPDLRAELAEVWGDEEVTAHAISSVFEGLGYTPGITSLRSHRNGSRPCSQGYASFLDS